MDLESPSSRIKIVHLARRYAPLVGGVEKHLEKLNSQLIAENYQVCVITKQTTENLPAYENASGVEVFRMSLGVGHSDSSFIKKTTYKLRIWQEFWKLRKIWFQADIIHIHDVFFWILPFWPLIYHKTFMTFHGYEGSKAPNFKQIFWHRLAAKLTKANLAIGHFHEKWYGVKSDFVSYGAVDSDFSTQKSLKKQENVLKIIYIGRLHEDTGIMTYLEAIKAAKEQGLRLHLDVYGDGPDAAKVKKFIEVHELPAFLKGFVKNADQQITNYDVAFVSRYLAILEAMSAGVPIIAHYNNQIKFDYLALAKYAKWINIVNDSAEILDLLKNWKNLSTDKKAQKWARAQTWQKMSKTYQQLWQLKFGS